MYCVYEDSGFLAESVRRIYPLMDRILFLIGVKPWAGEHNPTYPEEARKTIASIPDPDRKFMVVSKDWPGEPEERNDGLRILRDAKCGWCMIIDDDEMFNRSEVEVAKKEISADKLGLPAFTASQVTYWKNRDTVIAGTSSPLPLFVSTTPEAVLFTMGRCIVVKRGIWSSLKPETILCHHLSYVRSDDKMLRKIKRLDEAREGKDFYGAGEKLRQWFDQVWLRWTPEMGNLHPNPRAPWGFRKAVPAYTLPKRLEPLPDA